MDAATSERLGLATRCQHPADVMDMSRRCGRPESHPAHDPLGWKFGVNQQALHPFDNVPMLDEDGRAVYDEDDGHGFD